MNFNDFVFILLPATGTIPKEKVLYSCFALFWVTFSIFSNKRHYRRWIELFCSAFHLHFKMELDNLCIYIWHFKGKIAKIWTLKIIYPPFQGFVITDLVYHGFCLSRFSVSPKIRDKQGLPVQSLIS